MDKKKLVLRLILVLCIIFLNLYLFGVFDTKKEYNEYQEDFYKAVNKDYKKDDKDVSTRFMDAQKEVDKKFDELTKDYISRDSNAKVLYDQLLNTNNRDLGVIKQYIDSINNSNNITEFIDASMKAEYDLSVDIFTKVNVMGDMKKANKNIIYFEPISMDFGSPCYYYNDKDYDSYTAYLKKYGLKILNAYGISRPNEVSTNIVNLEKDICSESFKFSDYTNAVNMYNVVTKDELKSIYSNIDIEKYLTMYGIQNNEYYSIVDKGNLKKFNSLLTNDNLKVLKNFVILKILEQYSPYLSLDYINPYIEFYNTFNVGREIAGNEGLAIKTIEVAYSNTLGVEYTNKEFSNEKKEIINLLIKDLLDYYKENVNNLKWMSSTTKEKAIKKIDNMSINVGIGNNMPTYESSYVFNTNNSLISNIIYINNIERDYLINSLNNTYFYLDVPLTTVNAYYNVLDNSINFPTAIAEMFNEKDDYYEILGSMGMIIGHEITHAFGAVGAHFDEAGTLVDWWTEEDYKAYEELQKKVKDYYSSFEVFQGLKVDGEKTLDENISDLGGLHAITELARKKNAKDEDYKKMYEAYAKMWADNYTNEYLASVAVADNHSPDKVRVNAGLAALDKFKELYDIDEEAPMYRTSLDYIW